MKFQNDVHVRVALAIGLMAVVFVLGLSEPAGYAVWLGYTFPVLIAAWSTPPRYAFFITAICTVLIGLGFAFHAGSDARYVSLVNRSLDALMLWVVALLTIQRQHAQSERERLLEELAASGERQRLARELHDAVSQALFSASMIADVLPRLWQSNPQEGQRQIQELARLTRGAQAEMRVLLLELRPVALNEAPLAELLRQLTLVTAGRSKLQVTASVEEPGELPAEVKITLYRIAQEALNNVIKHAQATEARLELCRTRNEGNPERVELRISDNGHGFQLQGISSEHMGLRIMRERAESVGAQFGVESQVGRGTVIRVAWQPAA